MKAIRSYLIAGLILWLPILVTFAILRFIIDLLDFTMAVFPRGYKPEQLFGMHIPGFGLILSLILLFITGVIATNILGQRLFSFSESLLNKIPLVRSIYSSSKQVIHAIMATNGQAFRQVLLVEYPRRGMWSVAFQTSEECALKDPAYPSDYICVFIPTTPNPTSGFLMIVPKADTQPINMSPDEALKYVISLGVMQPSLNNDEILSNNKVF